jgi:hypothetical protein
MKEADVPKRVVVVLMFLVILVSFLGALTVLQLFATSPRAAGTAEGPAEVRIHLMAQPIKTEHSNEEDSATVSIKIQNYVG